MRKHIHFRVLRIRVKTFGYHRTLSGEFLKTQQIQPSRPDRRADNHHGPRGKQSRFPRPVRQPLDQRNRQTDKAYSQQQVNQTLPQKKPHIRMAGHIRQYRRHVHAEEIENPVPFLRQVNKYRPDDSQHHDKRHRLVLQQTHGRKRQSQHKQKGRQGNREEIQQIGIQTERRTVEHQRDEHRHRERNQIQPQKCTDNPPHFPDDVIRIAHRPHINHLRGIQFLIPLQEVARQKNHDDRLGDAVKINGKEGHQRRYPRIVPCLRIFPEYEGEIAQLHQGQYQQHQYREYPEKPAPFQQLHFIAGNRIYVVYIHASIVKVLFE